VANNITIYLLSEEEQLKNWAQLFSSTISLISNQIFNTKGEVTIEQFNGSLTSAESHIFLLTENTSTLSSKVAIDNANTYQVHLTPIEYKNIPSFLHNSPVFEFYDFDALNDKATWSNLDVSTGQSWERLLDFSKNIHKIYKKDKSTIYLAHTSPDQNANRDQLKRDLLNNGYNVVPETPLNNTDLNTLENQVTEYLKGASLSIHTYGNDTSDHSEDKLELIDSQNKICAKNNTSNFHRLIWLPTNARLNKENQEKISLLRKDLELLKGAEFVEAPLELFKSLTYQKIERISDNDNSNLNGLYLIYDGGMSNTVTEIKSEIENSQFNVLEVDNKGNNPLINHKTNLRNSDGIIIYYDGSNNNWIESILNDIIKTPKYRNHKNVNSIGIISNSELTFKPELESYNLMKIDLSDKSQLKTFIQNINK
jgi:hypothetical protein